MISICIAICDNDTTCLHYALRSLERKMSLTTEILIADFNFSGRAQDRIFDVGGVPAIQFKYDYPVTECYCHAIGLHQCIRRAKNEHLILMDHDVIMLKPGFDQFYLEIFDKYDLMLLGLGHYKSLHQQAFLGFPTVITAMVRKSLLPPPDWMVGQLKYRKSIYTKENDPADNYPLQHENFFMIQTPIPSMTSQFPNPKGVFDTGCNFWIWLNEQEGRWMSFRKSPVGSKNRRRVAPGPAVYTTKNANNFELQDDFGSEQLLFHCGAHNNRHQLLKEWYVKGVTTR